MVHEYSSSNILGTVDCPPDNIHCHRNMSFGMAMHAKMEAPGLYYSKLVLLFLIFILGTIGNTLAFLVMSRRTLRRTPVSVYLRFIAFFDTLVLWTGCLASIILKLTQPNDYLYSPTTCLFFKAVPEFARCVSAWLLMVLAVQRVITIYHARIDSGKKPFQRALIACFVTVSAWLLGYGYNFFIWETFHDDMTCAYSSWIDNDYKLKIEIWIINVAYAFLPAPVLTLCSIALVIKTVGQEKLLQKRWNKPASGKSKFSLPTKVKRMNIVIVTIAISYVCLTFPYAIAFSYFTSFAAEPPAALLYTEIPLYANHAINFLLYVCTGTKFRRELGRMLGCAKLKALTIRKSAKELTKETSVCSSTGTGLNSTENF